MHLINYDVEVEKLIHESGWLPASPLQLDIVLYSCLITAPMTYKENRALAYLYAQQSRSAGVHYELSGNGRKKLYGMSISQLATLLEKAMACAISVKDRQKSADCSRLAYIAHEILGEKLMITVGYFQLLTSKRINSQDSDGSSNVK